MEPAEHSTYLLLSSLFQVRGSAYYNGPTSGFQYWAALAMNTRHGTEDFKLAEHFESLGACVPICHLSLGSSHSYFVQLACMLLPL